MLKYCTQNTGYIPHNDLEFLLNAGNKSVELFRHLIAAYQYYLFHVCHLSPDHNAALHMSSADILYVMNHYRAKLRVARYCQGKLSLCLSVCNVEVS